MPTLRTTYQIRQDAIGRVKTAFDLRVITDDEALRALSRIEFGPGRPRQLIRAWDAERTTHEMTDR